MHRASAPSAPLASPDYYERLGRLQHGLRDSEKKRLDLEGKLYEYNQSDTCRVKLKYLKLKKYLKEICESEKKARTRNQEYLKRFERIQAHVGHFTTSSEKLQELKIEYETQIKKMQLLSKDSLGKKGELKDEDREKIVLLAGTQRHRSPAEKCGKSRRRRVRAAAVTSQFLFEQAPASGLWRTPSGQCVTTLKRHDNSIQEEVVAKQSEVFPVKNVDQRTRATALLKKGLTGEHKDRSAVHSSESSCSLPSTLNDNSGMKNGKPALWLSSVPTREREVSSGCGDESAEESVAARMPVTETKAYQMLKQSTLQDSAHQAEDGFQKAEGSASLSGLNIGSGTFKTKTTHKISSEASFSSSEGSPLSRMNFKEFKCNKKLEWCSERGLPCACQSRKLWRR